MLLKARAIDRMLCGKRHHAAMCAAYPYFVYSRAADIEKVVALTPPA